MKNQKSKIQKMGQLKKSIKKIDTKTLKSKTVKKTKKEEPFVFDQNDQFQLLVGQADDVFVLKGELQLRVFKGTIEILGAILTPSQQFHTINSNEQFSSLTLKIHQGQDQALQNEEIDKSLHQFDGIIQIRKNEQFQITRQQDSNEQKQVLWSGAQQQTVENLGKELEFKKSLRIMIAGSKNTGKSLFSIKILNSMLSQISDDQKVYYLETDLGQPQFGLPGFVSLQQFNKNDFQLTNSHQKKFKEHLIQYFLGEYSPQLYIQQYLIAISKCLQYYMDTSYNSPLIINTHGYLTNLGEIIFYDVTKLVDPHFILYLQENGKQEGNNILQNTIRNRNYKQRLSFYNELCNDRNRKDFISLDTPAFSINKTSINYHKKLGRDQLVMDYLLQHQSANERASSYFTRLNLIQPYIIKLKDLQFSLLKGIDNNKIEVNYQIQKIDEQNNIAQLFIGSLVFLYQAIDAQINESILGTQPCLGVGFVKDFDLNREEIHLISPLTQQDIDSIRIVIKSRDIDFCNNFYCDHQEESLVLSQCLGQQEIMGGEFSTSISGKLQSSYKQKVIRKMN